MQRLLEDPQVLGGGPTASAAAISDEFDLRHNHGDLGMSLSLHGYAQLSGRNGGQFRLTKQRLTRKRFVRA